VSVAYGGQTYQSKTTFITIQALPSIPVFIAIDQSQSARLAALTLAGFSNSNNPLKYVWSSETNCNDNNVYVQVPITAASTATPLNISKLKFNPGVLSASTSYCFKLSVSNSVNNAIGNAYYPITTGGGPTGGSCALFTSSNINALVDSFEYTCSGWTTDANAYPLKYHFEYFTVGSASTTFRTFQQNQSPTLLSKLPPGSFQIKVSIIDQFDNKYEYPTQVTIASTQSQFAKRDVPAFLTQLITNYTTGASANFNSTGDVAEALTLIATLNSVLNPYTDGVNQKSIRQLVIQFLGIVASQRNALDATVNIPTIASILSNMVGPSMDQSTCESIFVIVNQMSVVAGVAPLCYATATHDNLGTIKGSILTSLGALGVYSSAIAASFSATVENFDRCMLTGIVCNQLPVTQSSAGYTHVLGVADPSQSGNTLSTLFSNAAVALSSSGECVRFTKSSYINTAISTASFNPDKYIDKQAISYIPTVYNVTSNAVIVPNLSTSTLNFKLDVTAALVTKNNLVASYSSDSPPTGAYPVCASVNLLNAYTINGCTSVSYSANVLTCQCTTTGEFSVMVKAAALGNAPVATTTAAGTVAKATGVSGTNGLNVMAAMSMFAVIMAIQL